MTFGVYQAGTCPTSANFKLAEDILQSQTNPGNIVKAIKSMALDVKFGNVGCIRLAVVTRSSDDTILEPPKWVKTSH